jgi:hypothetical protein
MHQVADEPHVWPHVWPRRMGCRRRGTILREVLRSNFLRKRLTGVTLLGGARVVWQGQATYTCRIFWDSCCERHPRGLQLPRFMMWTFMVMHASSLRLAYTGIGILYPFHYNTRIIIPVYSETANFDYIRDAKYKA